MRLVIATRNADKYREISDILAGLPLDLASLRDYSHVPETPEIGETCRENALLKARAAARALGLPALADDSGLEVEALGGQPGVRSSRFAGEEASYADNNRKLLDLLKGVAAGRRRARFVCVAALVEPPAKETVVEGEVWGEIAFEERGHAGFGYDPVFLVPGTGKTFAELGLAEKQRISHRAQAFRRMRDVLEERLRRSGAARKPNGRGVDTPGDAS